jgi:hypothetical protein
MKRPQTMGEWIKLMNATHDVSDIMLAAQVKTTAPSIHNWKDDVNLPKILSILRMINYYSQVSGDSPEDILLEMFDSVPKYREINKEYRERQRKDSD